MTEEKPSPPENVPGDEPGERPRGRRTAAASKSTEKTGRPKSRAVAKTKTKTTKGKRRAAVPKRASPRKPAYSEAEIVEIFERFKAANPEPKGELEYTNAFTLVVAVVLSAQATDVSVNKATRELFGQADTPQKMVALGEYRISEYIKTIGLFRTKAKNVLALSQMLLDDYGGEVPGDREALVRLPGVGPKTANVVLNAAFGQPTIAVDTHIFRLANRLELAPGRTPAIVEEKLTSIIPDVYKRDSHHWLILHGRYVCTARKPDCSHCLIADLCKFPDKTSDVAFPVEPK